MRRTRRGAVLMREKRLSYTLQESHRPVGGGPLSNSPKHLVKVKRIAPLLSKKSFTSLEGQVISRRITVAGNQAGGSFVANATLFSKDLPRKPKVSASLYNLFSKRHAVSMGQEFLQPSIVPSGEEE